MDVALQAGAPAHGLLQQSLWLPSLRAASARLSSFHAQLFEAHLSREVVEKYRSPSALAAELEEEEEEEEYDDDEKEEEEEEQWEQEEQQQEQQQWQRVAVE